VKKENNLIVLKRSANDKIFKKKGENK